MPSTTYASGLIRLPLAAEPDAYTATCTFLSDRPHSDDLPSFDSLHDILTTHLLETAERRVTDGIVEYDLETGGESDPNPDLTGILDVLAALGVTGTVDWNREDDYTRQRLVDGRVLTFIGQISYPQDPYDLPIIPQPSAVPDLERYLRQQLDAEGLAQRRAKRSFARLANALAAHLVRVEQPSATRIVLDYNANGGESLVFLRVEDSHGTDLPISDGLAEDLSQLASELDDSDVTNAGTRRMPQPVIPIPAPPG